MFKKREEIRASLINTAEHFQNFATCLLTSDEYKKINSMCIQQKFLINNLVHIHFVRKCVACIFLKKYFLFYRRSAQPLASEEYFHSFAFFFFKKEKS